ncbi:hypothetical protein Bhyg_10760 [Pseudolycoriella hygida]|uniref:Uncharacterized protein n=1 Tax=Pseudolycoriella hygida TaxID=35572 RepID=A0A9Q0RZ01_9DIPT|nr:hypothetical protein Bhyg_10760 [Pseudolycoriella hygida]
MQSSRLSRLQESKEILQHIRSILSQILCILEGLRHSFRLLCIKYWVYNRNKIVSKVHSIWKGRKKLAINIPEIIQ